jgi:hypothetical protein
MAVDWVDAEHAAAKPVQTFSDHFSFTVSLNLSPPDTEETAADGSLQYRLKRSWRSPHDVVRRTERALKFPLSLLNGTDDDASFGLGHVRAGYGPLLADDTEVTRGRNGTAWEEPSSIYVKACFQF